MPTPATTEYSRESLRGRLSPGTTSEATSEGANSPILPRNLFRAGIEDSASDETRMSDDGQEDAEDTALGTKIAGSAEGYADDTYMLAMHLLSLLALLAATSRRLQVTGQEVNAKKSLDFTVTHSARKRLATLDAMPDGM